tara:strand:- start:216 stop:875 length:660 start_codon:yes stop_codon:yes gene_type:complete
MNFLEALNVINQRGTTALDNVLEAGNNLVKNVTLPSKKSIRKAGDDFIKTTINEGLIPIPAPTPKVRTGLGYIKSVVGVPGMPFRIGNNDKSRKFYQDTVDVATKTPDGKVIFNENIKDKEAYNQLGKNISNKDIGRYVGTIDNEGNVIVEDDYDTNRGIDWHLRRVITGENAKGDSRPINLSDRAISAASALHKFREKMGKTNPRPFGTYQNLGKIRQ